MRQTCIGLRKPQAHSASYCRIAATVSCAQHSQTECAAERRRKGAEGRQRRSHSDGSASGPLSAPGAERHSRLLLW